MARACPHTLCAAGMIPCTRRTMLSWPFLVANLFTLLLTTFLSVANHWSRAVPEPHPLPHGKEPTVGIIIPCCGEPVGMILRTVSSILRQDWPRERMVIVISDDGHDPALALAIQSWPALYHSPPPRFAPGRDGAAKSGNLNSAFAMLLARHPEIRYIETRDCDDELGSNGFLRQRSGGSSTMRTSPTCRRLRKRR